jgi:multicomponent Na+:H+ antiporter subunit E
MIVLQHGAGGLLRGKTMWLFLFLLWIVLNGRVTVELVIFGVVIATAVTVFADRVIGYKSATDKLILRNLPIFFLYILNLIREIIVSAFAMAGMVYSAEPPKPVIIEFHSGFDTRLQNVLLANSITLTPGTITIFQEGDYFVIHCLKREFGEGIEDSSFVRLLRKIR